MTETEQAREARREYYRRWRRENPERARAIQQRFYLRKAAEYNAEQRAQDPGTSPADPAVDGN